MLILCTAVLFHVLAIHGATWSGVTGAYVMALPSDFALIAFLIYRMTEKTPTKP